MILLAQLWWIFGLVILDKIFKKLRFAKGTPAVDERQSWTLIIFFKFESLNGAGFGIQTATLD